MADVYWIAAIVALVVLGVTVAAHRWRLGDVDIDSLPPLSEDWHPAGVDRLWRALKGEDDAA